MEQTTKLLIPTTNFKFLSHPSGMSVQLLDSMGDDISILNAARVSYGKESFWEYWTYDTQFSEFKQYPKNEIFVPSDDIQWYKCLSARDEGVLNYMMREKHGTPFEMVQFQFRIRAPIGVVWEWVRHRIASYNVMSTRYVEWERSWYTPEKEEWRTQIGKPGHYEFIPMDENVSEITRWHYNWSMEQAFDNYEAQLKFGTAKEVARNLLPMGAMTEFIWSVNLRALFNFLALRTAPEALKEIQICAKMVEDLTLPVVPYAMASWKKHNKQTP